MEELILTFAAVSAIAGIGIIALKLDSDSEASYRETITFLKRRKGVKNDD
jgi:hypothetical protein